MGKKGKKARAGKLTRKEISRRLGPLAEKLKEELEGADIFAPLPPTEDCAICCVPVSQLRLTTAYMACCGKAMCNGCLSESTAFIKKYNQKNSAKSMVSACPFCREPAASCEGYVRQLEARALLNDGRAHSELGLIYGPFRQASFGGFPSDTAKALDHFIQAAKMGDDTPFPYIASHYEKDLKKASLFDLAGALRGNIISRHRIGSAEYYTFGKHELGIRHWKIAAEAGMEPSLDMLKKICNADGRMSGKKFITKDDLDRIERVCREAQEAVKSEEREKLSKGDNWMKC